MFQRSWLKASCLTACVGLMSSMANAGEIQVLSAVVKGKTIPDATVTWQRTGESSVKVNTDAKGTAGFTQFKDDPDTTMLIEKEGYSTLVVKCPCEGFTYALSPEMPNLDGLRVVLTWGSSPSDLDSHMVFPDNHVFFSSKEGDQTHLDVDDTTSYGPETITVVKKKQGERYVYMVRDYSNGERQQSRALSASNARVDVYVGKTHIRSYKVRNDVKANSWVVFGIDGNGAFHDINQYLSLTRTADLNNHLAGILNADSFESHSMITDTMIAQAKRMNTAGEKAYQNKDYLAAMYHFQDAVNLYPDFSQAYSNLGVTYPKLDRRAEALWANRKAIELASGNRADRIKASSYYNIGRIYEASSEWQSALENFEAAQRLREHSAYQKGISRMKEKLHIQ
ncbi:tetratricopeptide repeat protein [Photobacterium sp. R1]